VHLILFEELIVLFLQLKFISPSLMLLFATLCLAAFTSFCLFLLFFVFSYDELVRVIILVLLLLFFFA
jgi:hypothetical protein